MTAAHTLTIAVPGTPVPQGSKSGVVNRAGRVQILEGRTSTQRARFHEWRHLVAQHAWVELARVRRTTPLLGPVAVDILFVHARPRSTKAGVRWRHKTPDLDKLTRAVLDALTTAGVYGDDGQVARLHAAKVLAEPDESAGAVITVTTLDHADAPGNVSNLLPAPVAPGTVVRGRERPQRTGGG